MTTTQLHPVRVTIPSPQVRVTLLSPLLVITKSVVTISLSTLGVIKLSPRLRQHHCPLLLQCLLATPLTKLLMLSWPTHSRRNKQQTPQTGPAQPPQSGRGQFSRPSQSKSARGRMWGDVEIPGCYTEVREPDFLQHPRMISTSPQYQVVYRKGVSSRRITLLCNYGDEHPFTGSSDFEPWSHL